MPAHRCSIIDSRRWVEYQLESPWNFWSLPKSSFNCRFLSIHIASLILIFLAKICHYQKVRWYCKYSLYNCCCKLFVIISDKLQVGFCFERYWGLNSCNFRKCSSCYSKPWSCDRKWRRSRDRKWRSHDVSSCILSYPSSSHSAEDRPGVRNDFSPCGQSTTESLAAS